MALSLAALFATVMMVGRAEAVTPPATTTLFIADPQLGVVGAIQSAGQTMYFEAITPAGSTEMSARLIDEEGRTIAISGHSMDSEWLSESAFVSTKAAPIRAFAQVLPSGLRNALDQSVFGRETEALVNLAINAGRTTAGAVAMRDDTAIGNLASITEEAAAAAHNYDLKEAAQVKVGRNSLGDLAASYRGASVATFEADFPEEENENGTVGRTEVSAEILSPSGAPVAYMFGGDDIPDAWSAKTFPARPANITNAITFYQGVGTALRGALLVARYAKIATAAEAQAITSLATAQIDKLLPVPTSAAAAASGPAIYQDQVEIWWKDLNSILGDHAEHSGTIVRHYIYVRQDHTLVDDNDEVFCNHGTCPTDHKHMKLKDNTKWRSGWRTGWIHPPHGTVPKGQPGAGQRHSCYKTGYDKLSGFLALPPFQTPGHNCNDDSWTQMRAIEHESFSLTGTRCEDYSLDNTAPGYND